MASLPWEIIVDVLRRLPVKDLLRFRSVSKPWRSLIDGPDFIKMHLENSMETSSNLGFVIYWEDALHWVDLDSLDSAVKLHHPLGRGTEVFGSCNGLLALLNTNGDLALWNPSTRRYRKLPISGIQFPPGSLRGNHMIVYGFGYDPISDDYKLVRLVQFLGYEGEDYFESEVKIYSAKSNTWKRLSDFPYYLLWDGGFGSGVLANNALHWVVTRKPVSDVSNFVFAIDLVTEKYHEVPLPDFKVPDFVLNVEVLRESLCLICKCPSPDFDIKRAYSVLWVMKEYGVKESWTKLCTVVPDVIGPFGFVLPIAYFKSDNQVLMNKNGEQFIMYDVKRERDKMVKIYGAPRHMETKTSVESLVGLDDIDGPYGWKRGEEDRKPKMKDEKQRKKKQRDDFLSQGFKLVL